MIDECNKLQTSSQNKTISFGIMYIKYLLHFDVVKYLKNIIIYRIMLIDIYYDEDYFMSIQQLYNTFQ